jgi:hypothetical protein
MSNIPISWPSVPDYLAPPVMEMTTTTTWTPNWTWNIPTIMHEEEQEEEEEEIIPINPKRSAGSFRPWTKSISARNRIAESPTLVPSIYIGTN